MYLGPYKYFGVKTAPEFRSHWDVLLDLHDSLTVGGWGWGGDGSRKVTEGNGNPPSGSRNWSVLQTWHTEDVVGSSAGVDTRTRRHLRDCAEREERGFIGKGYGSCEERTTVDE